MKANKRSLNQSGKKTNVTAQKLGELKSKNIERKTIPKSVAAAYLKNQDVPEIKIFSKGVKPKKTDHKIAQKPDVKLSQKKILNLERRLDNSKQLQRPIVKSLMAKHSDPPYMRQFKSTMKKKRVTKKTPNLSSCLIVRDEINQMNSIGDTLQYEVLEASKSITSLKIFYEEDIKEKSLAPAKPFSAIMLMILLELNAELHKKQQNSLIAGLRATNEFNVQQDLQEDKMKENNIDKEVEVEPKNDKTMHINENKGLKPQILDKNLHVFNETRGFKEAETRARAKPKPSTAIPRSDSVGSASGRKYLAPTLSDPTRSDKEKVKNSKRIRAPVEGTDVQKILQREVNSKPHSAKVSSITVEVRDWWSDQLGHNSDSSEEE